MVPVLLIGLVKILTFVESFGISYQGFTKFHKVSDNLDFDNNVESEFQLKIIGLQGSYITKFWMDGWLGVKTGWAGAQCKGKI